MGEGQFRSAYHPWQAAFVAYCNGAPADEISQIFDIPLRTLRSRMQHENWAKLRDKLPLGTGETALPAKINAKLEVIADNRRVNLEAFAELREHAIEMVTALKEGRLKVQKQFHNKGSVVTCEAAPGPVQAARQDDLLLFERGAEQALDRAAQLGPRQIEAAGDAQLVGPGAEQIRRPALAQEQAQGS